jgi:hypothetical protein
MATASAVGVGILVSLEKYSTEFIQLANNLTIMNERFGNLLQGYFAIS